jgi:uncharacterized protein YggE
MRPLLALIAPLVLTTALTLPALAQEGTISVVGMGEVSAAPDTAFVMSGVTTQGATAREALDANNEAMTALIETLKAAGIEERDIQTSGFSVTPNYVYTDARDANGYTLPPKINGYSVFNNVNVRVRDLANLGAVLDQQVTVGANTISGVTFSVDDPSKLLDEARKLAFADAKARAEIYAASAGIELEAIRSISEGQMFEPPQPYAFDRAEFAAGNQSVPIQGGELTFQINVNVTWSIDD